jgi:uncharacterized protein (TIGR01777 family)
MTEANGEVGHTFSENVALAWERAFYDFELPHTRQIALRMSIILGQGGGALQTLVNLAKYGLGGTQGHGRQMLSWVHIEDVYRAIAFLQAQHSIEGVFNITAPNPIPNNLFMQAIRQQWGRGVGLPAPAWLIKMGAALMGTEPELVLKSRWVLPARIQAAGFTFKYDTIEAALKNLAHA